MSEQTKLINRVMIADDNAFVRFLLKRWLGDVAEIVEVSSGKDVINAYKAQRCDIVFLDIHLPGLSGKDVLKDLRRMDPEAYIVMISADSNKENVVDAVKLGAKAFITKPFTRETLNRYYQLCPTITRLASFEMPATGQSVILEDVTEAIAQQ